MKGLEYIIDRYLFVNDFQKIPSGFQKVWGSQKVVLLVSGKWINIAGKRPTSQSSAQIHYLASCAVDQNPYSCSQTRHLVKQMGRVD